MKQLHHHGIVALGWVDQYHKCRQCLARGSSLNEVMYRKLARSGLINGASRLSLVRSTGHLGTAYSDQSAISVHSGQVWPAQYAGHTGPLPETNTGRSQTKQPFGLRTSGEIDGNAICKSCRTVGDCRRATGQMFARPLQSPSIRRRCGTSCRRKRTAKRNWTAERNGDRTGLDRIGWDKWE